MTDYYIDYANGSNANDGTSQSTAFRDFQPVESNGPVDLDPGDTVYVDPSSTVEFGDQTVTLIGVRGTADQPITIESLDPSTQAQVAFSNLGSSDGWNLAGARHFQLKRIESYTTDISGRWGLRISQRGSDKSAAYDVLVEDCTFHHFDGNQFIGLANTRDCTFRRCVAHGGRDGGNADGFAVTNGAANYLLVDCEAYDNADDGYDLRMADGNNPSTLRRCISHDNGIDGDGLGFKSGNATTAGSTGGAMYERCVSYNNPSYGFRFSGEPGYIYNCTAFNNGNEGFYATDSGYDLVNNVTFQNETATQIDESVDTTATNTWTLDISSPEFVSTNPGDDGFLIPSSSSPLVDAGTDVGMSYEGPAPDIGAYPAPTTDDGSTSGPSLKVQAGGGFETPAAVRYYDGDQWVPASVKVADGGSFTTAFTATDVGLDQGDVLDDFERSDPLAEYRGDTDSFRAVSSPTYRESAAIQYDASGGGVVVRDSPSQTVERGRQYRLELYAASTGTYARFHFLAAGTTLADVSGYCVEYDTASASPQLKLFRFDDGQPALLAETDITPRVDEWVSLDVSTTATQVGASLTASDDTLVGAVAGTDERYGSGTYGFGGFDPRVTFDALKLL
jgi:hypothetical protein